MRAAILSAIYSAGAPEPYDTPKPPREQDGAEVEWLMVTDDPALDAPGWEVLFHPRPGVHPNRAAKAPKMLPWNYTDADLSIWIDASFRVVSPTFVTDVLAHAKPLAQFVHPWRSDLYLEAEASLGIPKYAGEPIREQMAHYLAEKMPLDFGLWATGVIARDHTFPAVVKLGERWLEECNRWSFQDQLSEPFVLREIGLAPNPLPGTHLSNAWLAYEGSANH
jgi:alkaline ceramidase TOD1/glycosyltransferase MUCI70-like protein